VNSIPAPAELSPFAQTIFERTYAHHKNGSYETWEDCAARVAKTVACSADQEATFYQLIKDRVFIPGGRYLYSSGRPKFTNSNCYGFMVGDSREEWAQLLHDVTLCLSTGGGLGVNYSQIRPSGSPIKTFGGVASGPLALMQMVNEVARHVMAGGSRRSALWAGLAWNHPDIQAFITAKDWNADIREMKAKYFDYPAPLDMTNISVIIDDEYLAKLAAGDRSVVHLHYQICESMVRTGEPAFRNQSRILEDDPGAITGNACQESTLHDRDTCNLGSIVMPRIRSLEHLELVTRAAIQFLYNGSILGSYPTEQIADVAKRNRRIGLGLMGFHEFCLLNEQRYEWSSLLADVLGVWKEASTDEAKQYSASLNGNLPVTTRAIAPTGTISIIAETTSGIEPIFCLAYKRRFLKNGVYNFQYVVDPTANRMLTAGIPTTTIEDTYQLSQDIERRLLVQATVQGYVDQAISNTVNLPTYGTEGNTVGSHAIADMVGTNLSFLKGLTVYPNGARAGQPLVPVELDEALGQTGVTFEEESERCLNGVCGV
jgi:ribonucleoside-diphosphate reductase alpha chain